MRRMESPNLPAIKYHPSTLGMQRHRGIWCLPSTPAFLLDAVTEFEMKPTDVIVVSYPKGGVEWLAEVVWMVHNCKNNPLRKSGDIPLETRVPFLEHRNNRLPDPLSLISSRDSPRLMMTHLASFFFDVQLEYRRPKVVMALRDPRDTLVAQYDWYSSNPYFAYPGKWEDFFQLFHSKLLIEGDWFDHTLSWWEIKDEPNILILKFEDLYRDPVRGVRAIAKHCGRSISEGECDKIAQYITKTLQEDGHIGQWKKRFSQTQADTISRLFRSYFEGSGLSFRGSGNGGSRTASPQISAAKQSRTGTLRLPGDSDRGRRSTSRLGASPDSSTPPRATPKRTPSREDSKNSSASSSSSTSSTGTQTHGSV